MEYRKITVMHQSVLTAKLPYIKMMSQFSHGKMMLNLKTRYMNQSVIKRTNLWPGKNEVNI